MSVIVGAVTTRAARRAVASERARGDLAAEQAALRRVATLVASGARPAEVFTAVADDLGRLIGAEATFFARVDHLSGESGEPEGDFTVVGSYGRVTDDLPVGFPTKLQIRDGHDGRPPSRGPGADHRRGAGDRPVWCDRRQAGHSPRGGHVRRGRGTPLGCVGGDDAEDFPAGTEARMTDFMELAAMAVANAQAEQKIRELADTQASLRRLAMLVARGEPPEAVFAAVTKEVLRHSVTAPPG